MVLSNREKMLIGILGVLLVGVLLFYGIQGIASMGQGLQKEISSRENYHRQALAITAEMAKLESRPQQPARTRSLIGFVEQLARRINLGERVQLNLIPNDNRSGLQGIDIKVSDLTLDEMFELLFALENSEIQLMIQQLELNPSFRHRDLLRLSIRVLARS